jgi:CRP-like cAMP-binding protein
MPVSKEFISSLLSSNDTFAKASSENLSDLADGFSEREVAAGEMVIKQGERGDEMFVVMEGDFEVVIADKNGNVESTSKLQVGGIFGEIAALTGGKRMAGVRALTDGKVMVIGHDALQRVLHASPGLTEAICLSLAKYIGG